jgi:hypothetical protein
VTVAEAAPSPEEAGPAARPVRLGSAIFNADHARLGEAMAENALLVLRGQPPRFAVAPPGAPGGKGERRDR